MATEPTFKTLRGRFSNMVRHHGPESPETITAKRDMKAARIAEWVARELEDAPPLTNAQLGRISSILYSGRRGGGA